MLIVVDDLGWMDLGCYGSKYYETPGVDRLAASGTRFTDAYAAAAVCSPTRAAIMTGRYPARLGITDWIRARSQGGTIPPDRKNPTGFEDVGQKLLTPQNALWMELEEVTVADVLRSAGYLTAHIGKWHLGPDGWYPTEQGFDVNIGGCDYGQPPTYFSPFATDKLKAPPGLPEQEPNQYLTDREAAEAVQFIRNNHQRPFFLYLAHYAVHTPLQAKTAATAKYEQKPKAGQQSATYAAMIESVDDATKNVLAVLDELKIADRTVVIFTSDNGGLSQSTNNAPLRAGKGTPYEGGIRVPLIIRWPAIEHQPPTSSVPVSSIDLFPTILDMAAIEPPADVTIDGQSLVGILEGEDQNRPFPRDALFWHFPHYRNEIKPYGIVRAGEFKLIRNYETGEAQLYDLSQDVGEQKNLAEEMPDKIKQLDVMLSKWLIGIGAKMPKPK
ncbi:MAG: sulfatase-like hydrolase/transferase [Planctomycetales bacterium]|nr:sulfatase-like hydrolase/transferase [Planctomycetales bacterium]NIN09570.1 sulfatase-like hydrolase/transferase [Planctomycetales bacterium]NIO47619.1 sulfatase-like hydrolase/transferase [Planctomycetales bacterium]NIP05748.1 sulfatase-like hydrolase/transferase [Planctomycetales bacterium]NIP71177.1 sulfatase-like hydrolase/transferase [Planctomycetales bacterium]